MKRKENVSKLLSLIEVKRQHEKSKQEITKFLVNKGIERILAEEFASEIQAKSAQNNEKVRIALLQNVLSKKILTSGGFQFEEKKTTFAALVGPTGVGKTTTLLKLANLYKHQHGKKVAILSLDGEKGGAFEQLSKYASQWKIPLFIHKQELKDTFFDLILIDTAGCNYYQSHRIEELGAHLYNFSKVEIHLTLSAATKDVDHYGAIHQFSTLDLKGLLFTKLDETLANGVLVNIASKTMIPISYVTYGYPLPGEIQVANAEEIIHKVLADFNQKEFHFLRSLSYR